jgi:D-sedoheptulose 7-phosphate isomerase
MTPSLHLDTYLNQVADTLAAIPRPALAQVSRALWETYRRDGTILVCGNGGSAATATHFACDLAKWTCREDRPRVRALALTDNVALMTAWSNDTAYERVFVEQLHTHYRPGDLLVAISGSGNSPNVIGAVAWANERGMPTVGLTGFNGGKLAQMVSYSLHVENHMMPQVEDAHSTICHALAVQLGLQIAQLPAD